MLRWWIPVSNTWLVLKRASTKESDGFDHSYTQELGVISASTARQPAAGTNYSAPADFCYSEFVLLPGRNMATIEKRKSAATYFTAFSSHHQGTDLAMYLAEMAAAPFSPTGRKLPRNCTC